MEESGWEELRRQMVDRQLRSRNICDPRVLAAMLRIPRHEFVPEPLRRYAYADEPVSIGFGQTISQPYMIALMVQCLELDPADSVLEVGAGCGYHAAVLGALAGKVISMEIIPELAALARENLERAGAGNVEVVCGDGSEGLADYAPYDAVSVPAAASEIPQALIEQLKDGGRLVIPVGWSWEQELRVVRKLGGELISRTATHCRFVPLRGACVSAN